MEIEDLRVNLGAMPMSLLSQAEGGPEIARLSELVPSPKRGNDSSVLGRMRDRIMNGQEWNVREAWSYGFVETTYEGGSVMIQKVTETGWHVIDDNNSTIIKQIPSTAPNGDTVLKTMSTT